jgi:hypothetical protein
MTTLVSGCPCATIAGRVEISPAGTGAGTVRPEEPAIHRAAVRLSLRLVGIIEPCLAIPEAAQRALTESCSTIRFSLKEFEQQIRNHGKAR